MAATMTSLSAGCAALPFAPAGPLEVGPQPKPRPKPAAAAAKPQRQLYGQIPEFVEVREAYHAVMSKEEASAADRWARSMLSSRSAVESNPAKVEPMMQVS